MLERKYIDIWISRAKKAKQGLAAKQFQGRTDLEFILDVIRKLSGKFKVQTHYAILDLLSPTCE